MPTPLFKTLEDFIKKLPVNMTIISIKYSYSTSFKEIKLCENPPRARDKIMFICPGCKFQSIGAVNEVLKNGICKKCLGSKIGPKNTITYEMFCDLLEQKNWKMISKKNEFVPDKTKKNQRPSKFLMKVLCSKGHPGKTSYNRFKENHGCNTCADNACKASWNKILNCFENANCKILIQKDEYVNNLTPIPFICSCGNKDNICWLIFARTPCCSKCHLDKVNKYYLENFGDENTYNQKDIISYNDVKRRKNHRYTFPNGKQIRVAGYEKYALNDLVKLYDKHTDDMKIIIKDYDISKDIIVNETKIPVFHLQYLGSHKYTPDFFIKSATRVVEVKCLFTYLVGKYLNKAKYNAVLNQGYNFTLLIYNKDKKLKEKSYTYNEYTGMMHVYIEKFYKGEIKIKRKEYKFDLKSNFSKNPEIKIKNNKIEKNEIEKNEIEENEIEENEIEENEIEENEIEENEINENEVENNEIEENEDDFKNSSKFKFFSRNCDKLRSVTAKEKTFMAKTNCLMRMLDFLLTNEGFDYYDYGLKFDDMIDDPTDEQETEYLKAFGFFIKGMLPPYSIIRCKCGKKTNCYDNDWCFFHCPKCNCKINNDSHKHEKDDCYYKGDLHY